MLKRLKITADQLLKVKNRTHSKDYVLFSLSEKEVIVEKEFLKLVEKIADKHDEELKKLTDF